MGAKEIMRVPLDFDWPANRQWDGYVNPHNVACVPCGGSGSTNGYRRLDDVIRLLFEGEHECDHGRVSTGYVRSPDWFASGDAVPGADYADLCARLAVHPDPGTPRDKGRHRDTYSAMHKILCSVGLDPEQWGTCPSCHGHGIPPDHRELHDTWRETDPPEGAGFQAWKCRGAECPISPVFSDVEGVVDWVLANAVDIGVGRPGTRDEWTRLARGEMVMLPFRSVT